MACKAKILLMDDDEIIRIAIQSLLDSLGYKTMTCNEGAAAINLYRRALDDREPFDAVVLDLTVPTGMNGLETIKELLLIDPHVKAVVSSGFSQERILTHYHEYGFVDIVQKPYKIEELDQVLTRVLQLEEKSH